MSTCCFTHWPHLCWIIHHFLCTARHRRCFKGSLFHRNGKQETIRKKTVAQIIKLPVASHECKVSKIPLPCSKQGQNEILNDFATNFHVMNANAGSWKPCLSSLRSQWGTVSKKMLSCYLECIIFNHLNYITIKSCMDSLVAAPTRFTLVLFKLFFLGMHLS